MELELSSFMEAVPAPPVVLVSTLNGTVKNIAPYGMNMPISFDPPLYAVGVGHQRDTAKNILDTGDFVVCIPSPELVAAINTTAREYPRDVSEFKEAGLTPAPSRVVKPFQVAECQAHLECVLEWHKSAGDHYVMIGRVVAASVNDSFVAGADRVHRAQLDPVYHDGVFERLYARKGEHIQ